MTVKAGRGVEISLEALLAILRGRFPDLVDWDEFSSASVDWSPQVQKLGLYAINKKDDDYIPEPADFPMKTLGEGAPVPTVTIGLRELEIN